MKEQTKKDRAADNRAAMRKVLDYFVVKPKFEPACRAAGKPSKWIWGAIRKSTDGDPDYLLSWPNEDDPPEQFADLLMKARRMWRIHFDNSLRDTAAMDEIPVIVNGKQMWQEDPVALAKWDNKEDAENIGGYYDWPYAHRKNEKGELERIPLMQPIAPAAAFKIHAARSMLGEQGWNPAETKVVDAHVGGEVLIVGTRGRASYAKDAPAPESPLRKDLAARLADLRANGPKHKYPLDERGVRTIPTVPPAGIPDPPERDDEKA